MSFITKHGGNSLRSSVEEIFSDYDDGGSCWSHVFLGTGKDKAEFGKIKFTRENVGTHIAHQHFVRFRHFMELSTVYRIVGDKI